MLRLTAQAQRPAYAFAEAVETTLLFTIEAPEDDASAAARLPVDMVVVLDRSGSMGTSNKLRLCKETIGQLANELRGSDRLGIVTYSSEATTTHPLTAMDDIGRAALLASLERVHSGGGTNLSGGLLSGVAHLAAAEPREGQRLRSVLLLTDGEANEGVFNPQMLVALAKDAVRKAGEPQLFTFGYGERHNEDLLTALGTGCGGRYFFARHADEVRTAFADCLGGLFSVAAQTLRLRVTAAGGAVFVGAPLTKQATTPVDGGFSVELPDIYAGERRNVLVKARLPALTAPVDAEADAAVAEAELTFANCRAARLDVVAASLGVARPAAVPADAPENAEVAKQLLRFETAQALEEAGRLADGGDLPGARVRVGRMRDLLVGRMQFEGAAGAARDEDLHSWEMDLASAAEDFTPRLFTTRGRRANIQRMFEHGMERGATRSMAMDDDASMGEGASSSRYRTSGQSSMRSKWTQASKLRKPN